MRLVGAPRIELLNPRLVDANSLSKHTDPAPIPASPYVYIPPAKSVRSPAFPDTPQTRDGLVRKIAELKKELADLDKSSGGGSRYMGIASTGASLFLFKRSAQ